MNEPLSANLAGVPDAPLPRPRKLAGYQDKLPSPGRGLFLCQDKKRGRELSFLPLMEEKKQKKIKAMIAIIFAGYIRRFNRNNESRQ